MSRLTMAICAASLALPLCAKERKCDYVTYTPHESADGTYYEKDGSPFRFDADGQTHIPIFRRKRAELWGRERTETDKPDCAGWHIVPNAERRVCLEYCGTDTALDVTEYIVYKGERRLVRNYLAGSRVKMQVQEFGEFMLFPADEDAPRLMVKTNGVVRCAILKTHSLCCDRGTWTFGSDSLVPVAKLCSVFASISLGVPSNTKWRTERDAQFAALLCGWKLSDVKERDFAPAEWKTAGFRMTDEERKHCIAENRRIQKEVCR